MHRVHISTQAASSSSIMVWLWLQYNCEW